MHVIDHARIPRAALPGIDHLTLAGSGQGLRHLSVWRQSVAPGAATPPHRHDCEEVVVCQGGRGELHLNGQVHAFGPETTVTIPRNVPHQIFSTGKAPLEIVAVFAATPVEVFLPDGTRLDLPWPT